MNKYLSLNQLAQAYGCGPYNADSYDEASCGTSTDPSPESPPLADTGYDVLIPIFIAISVIGAGILLLIKRWRRAKRSEKS